jgi:hypothetical protein
MIVVADHLYVVLRHVLTRLEALTCLNMLWATFSSHGYPHSFFQTPGNSSRTDTTALLMSLVSNAARIFGSTTFAGGIGSDLILQASKVGWLLGIGSVHCMQPCNTIWSLRLVSVLKHL